MCPSLLLGCLSGDEERAADQRFLAQIVTLYSFFKAVGEDLSDYGKSRTFHLPMHAALCLPTANELPSPDTKRWVIRIRRWCGQCAKASSASTRPAAAIRLLKYRVELSPGRSCRYRLVVPSRAIGGISRAGPHRHPSTATPDDRARRPPGLNNDTKRRAPTRLGRLDAAF